MPDVKTIFGILPIVLSVPMSVWYIRETLLGHVKPHAFTWLIWSTTSGIAFFGTLVGGAEAGSWAMGYFMFACFATFLLALWKGDRSFPAFDWISLSIAVLSLVPWYVTKNPFWSVVIVTFIDTCAYFPTFRKMLKKPFEESMTLFVVGNIQYTSSLLAVTTYTLTTTIYQATSIVMNFLVIGMLFFLRRKQMKTA